MSFLPEILNSHFRAFAAGLLDRLMFCASWCVKYAASYTAGIGPAFSSALLLSGATGWLLKAPLFRKCISIFGAGILIVIGGGTSQTQARMLKSINEG
jgi:hypothetical protein